MNSCFCNMDCFYYVFYEINSFFPQGLIASDLPKAVQLLNNLTEQVLTKTWSVCKRIQKCINNNHDTALFTFLKQ